MIDTMPSPVQFRYFLYDLSNPVTHRNKAWSLPLPCHAQDQTRRSRSNVDGITHGDYFKAVKAFFEIDRFEAVLYGVFRLKHQEISLKELGEIRVILSKHGEFYHPSRIEVSCLGEIIPMVLNVALSSAGKAVIEQEFGLLDDFNGSFFHHYLPEVYGFGEAPLGKNGSASLFLGEWFEGYHEFHLSEGEDGIRSIRLWDTENGYVNLSHEEAQTVYRKIAHILTACYDVSSFRQIFPWHHAAGDFVVKKEAAGINVKLITVRQYAAMIEGPDDDLDFRSVALLVFLLNLSIRMRLDRMDGTGEMVWLDDYVVPCTVEGFFDGLTEQMKNGLLADDFLAAFKTHVHTTGPDQLIETAMAIVDSYHPEAPEVALIRAGIQTHLTRLIDVLGEA